MVTFGEEVKAKAAVSVNVADQIRPYLAGRDPGIIGAILADLTVQWVLGHHPEDRAMILHTHREAIEVMIKLTIRKGLDPWEGKTG